MNDYLRGIILIPTLNEKENLEELVPKIFSFMPDISVLIVDDDSRDGTRGSVRRLQEIYENLFLLERNTDFGYGRSSIEGFKWILEKGYDYLVTMDADFSHDFQSIPALCRALDKSDVAIGSRYVAGGQLVNWRWYRRLLSNFANNYVRIILRMKIKDVTSGFCAYRVAALKRIDLESFASDGYAFLIELKYCLVKLGANFLEVPITFTERREGQSKMSFKIMWESVWLPWQLLFFK